MSIVIKPEYAHAVMVDMGVFPLEPYPGAKVGWRSRCLSCGDSENCAPHFSTVHGRWKKWQEGADKRNACNACAQRTTAEKQRVRGFATTVAQLEDSGWRLLTHISKYRNQKTSCDVECVKCLARHSGPPDSLKSAKKCECRKAARQPLRDYRPDLFSQIHPTRNEGLNLARVGTGTRAKIWWLCPESSENFAHEYSAAPANRILPSGGCPYCKGLRPIPGVSDFASVAEESFSGSELVGEFASNQPLMTDPDTLEKIPLHPSRVAPHSNLRANWICADCKYGYAASFAYRMNGQGCPACAGKRVHVGVNDLASLEPDIASEWHPTRNGSLSPKDFTQYSGKEVWWECEERHEWPAPIASRTNMRSGCPSCAETGYRPERAGMLYLLTHQTHQARKFGITNFAAKTLRLVRLQRAGWEVLLTLQNRDGSVAKDVEKMVKSWIRDELKLPQVLESADMPDGGHTETFPLYQGPSDREVMDFYRTAWSGRVAGSNQRPG